MKLNIGSNKKKLDGFKNMDIQKLDGVDYVQDLLNYPYYGFVDNSVDEIVSQETLEHLPFREIVQVLREWRRILKEGGKLHIEVPDIGKMCDYYYENRVCDCVVRKADSYDKYKADPDCKECWGNAIIHPERWRFAFSGAQKHEWDTHLTHFTREILLDKIRYVGFHDIVFHENIYKLVVTCIK